jgi:hypothetical protein
MEQVEQENAKLRGEVATLRAELEKLNDLVALLVAVQNQPPPTPQITVISEIVSTSVSATLASTPQHTMPEGYQWGMPFNFNEEFQSYVSEVSTPIVQHTIAVSQPGITFPQATMSVPQPKMIVPTPVVHTIPYVSEHVYHAGPTVDKDASGHMDSIQDQFDKMQLEIKALVW